MKVKINKKLYNFIILFGCIFSAELILKLIRGSYLINWSMFRIILSSIIISIFLSNIFSLFKEKNTKKLIIIMCFFVSFYAWLQLGFYRYVGTYMSFNNSSQASKVFDFLWDFLFNIPEAFYLEFIPLGLLLIYYFVILPILKKKKNIEIELTKDKKKRPIWLNRIIRLSYVLFLVYIYYLTLVTPSMQSKYQSEKNIDLFIIPDNQSVAVNQFGITMFSILDFNNFVFVFNKPVEEVPIVKPQKPIIVDNSRKIDDTKWLTIAGEETNYRNQQLNNYFLGRRITPKNSYTGMLNDKNVIFVMMESVGMLGINEELFPTLYKLWDNGISFTNFYSPRNSCPTGNNEMTAMTGLFSITDSCTANAYRRNNYPQALFYKFRENNYYASSYHNYIDYYYYRKDIHANCGSEVYYNAPALGIKNVSNKRWPSDIELFEKGLPNFINQDKFVSFMTTVTTHSPYHSDSEFGIKNIDLFSELVVTDSMKRYYSKVYELDLALKYLLENLETTGKLNDTVIILFGDHQPYDLGVKQQVDILGEEYGLNKNLEKTPLIIYNPNIQKQQVTDYASIIDILPTVLNLFDIEHDPRIYLGTDLFDNEIDHRLIFPDGSWQDEIGFYNSSNDSFIPNNPEDLENIYTDEKILEINTEINLRLRMSTLAIKNNYFYDLNKKLTNN